MNSKDYSDIRVELNSNSIFLVKKNSYFILLAMMSLILILTLIFALSMGRYSINFSTIIKVLISKLIDINIDWSITEQQVIESVRMPRILVAGLCGASLALGGSALQGLFRNPLVGPQVIGVSSGAAFGGVIAILLMLPDFYIAIFAFLFGVIALLVAMMIAKSGGGKNVLSLVLAGIVTSAFFTSLVSLVKYVADPNNTLPSIVYWLMGSFNESRYIDVIYILLPLLTVGIIIFKMRYVINILSLGEEEASSMGVNVNFSRWVILLSTAILIAASVSVSGIIGWVGLIIPHFARMIVGSNHGKLIPISMFIGAIYLILVDVFSRTVSYGEIPIGVITAIFGAPIFAWLLYKSQLRGWRHD